MGEGRRNEVIANCNRFFGSGRKSVRDQLREVAESKYAELKQDQYGSGGFVTVLEEEVAELLGKEAAVFMPSGTMAQQIALRIWCDHGASRRVSFHPKCHLEIHEQGAYRELHQLESSLVGDPNRLFTLADLAIVPDPVSALLIELPQREIGGQLPSWEELQAICGQAKSRGIKLHMDGARLWECGPYYKRSYAEISEPFDSVYVSFYKILAGLPGAILAGPTDFVKEARIWQRRHGGNLYQLSPNAIAAKLGMDRHLAQIPKYVAKASEFAKSLGALSGVKVVPSDPPTNMMHLHLRGSKEELEERALAIAEETGILLFAGLRPITEGWCGFELSVGDSGLGLEPDLVKSMFERVVGS